MSELRERMALRLAASQSGHQMAGPPEYLADLEEPDDSHRRLDESLLSRFANVIPPNG